MIQLHHIEHLLYRLDTRHQYYRQRISTCPTQILLYETRITHYRLMVHIVETGVVTVITATVDLEKALPKEVNSTTFSTLDCSSEFHLISNRNSSFAKYTHAYDVDPSSILPPSPHVLTSNESGRLEEYNLPPQQTEISIQHARLLKETAAYLVLKIATHLRSCAFHDDNAAACIFAQLEIREDVKPTLNVDGLQGPDKRIRMQAKPNAQSGSSQNTRSRPGRLSCLESNGRRLFRGWYA
ncbi:hypothetical protein M378DRAFT_422611 [Amanita muscaria Koide BX008]|uniref:Uncharacterized protein n=1 Tax=Amanita muscaria (strain Koide BX008) TaxID=946122 RepID=A0A0C2WLF0_AMAMK|nr:hypothetical protein M378DRAFT_422611 [Amanita muscaria Koide BX008]